jgi:hypothetical protein
VPLGLYSHQEHVLLVQLDAQVAHARLAPMELLTVQLVRISTIFRATQHAHSVIHSPSPGSVVRVHLIRLLSLHSSPVSVSMTIGLSQLTVPIHVSNSPLLTNVSQSIQPIVVLVLSASPDTL